jgi:DNA-binding SARP family transcriptional activator
MAGTFYGIWWKADKRRANCNLRRTVSNGREALGSQEPPKAV